MTSTAPRDTVVAPAPPHVVTPAVDLAGVPVVDLAAEAAATSGVEIVLLHEVAELERVADLFGRIWRSGKEQPPVSRDLMRALSHAGNYVAAAVADGEVLGACVGFFGGPGASILHSHIAGVAPEAQGRSIGQALKLHQHLWALQQGVEAITWTYDPLLGRNAFFNIAKLGARPTAYLPDFYGAMTDGLNAGQGSDRLLVSWSVRPTLTTAAATGRDRAPEGAGLVLDVDADGAPTCLSTTVGDTVLVRTPHDLDGLRRTHPATARRWREAVRDVLGGLMASGGSVVGFTRDGCYVVDRSTAVDKSTPLMIGTGMEATS